MKELTIQEKKIQRAIACLRMAKSPQEAMRLGANDNIDSSQWKIAERKYKKEGKEMKTVNAYKLARPDGWDFYTGKTINYREAIGKSVCPPEPNAMLGVCSSGVIHASKEPLDCFVGANIPCSAYRVEGIPVCGKEKKWGFIELQVLEELPDLDTLFGFKYTEACNPVNPFKARKHKVTKGDIKNLRKWASVWGSVEASVWASVGASVGASVWARVRDSVRDSVRARVRDSVWTSVRDSVWASVGAYIGSLFPNIKHWKYVNHEESTYPFQSAVDLWCRGFVPTFDGMTWRLHAGKDAEIVYEEAK
jgi:hypothetical protein